MTADQNESRTILISAHFKPEWVERITQLAPNVHVELQRTLSHKEISDELWQHVEIWYSFAFGTLPTPEQAPRLRWVQLYSAGAERALNTPLFQAGVRFTTVSGIHAVPIGEYVLMVALAWLHQLPVLFSWQQQSLWPKNVQRSPLFRPQNLRGKTVGIVGYGSIGREVARLMKGCGADVLAMQRGSNHHDTGFILPGVGDPEGMLPDRYYNFSQLHEMLAECDIVVVSVPLTAETRELFNADAFKAMKPGAFFINIARGDIVDEAALIHALEEQQIAGAALDVYHEEPLPASSPLWKLPNVILSPHITGIFAEYDELAATIFIANVERYLKGEPLYNEVDREKGY
jgi:phosphoglycerate dehydrogenase-like enzyme